jgi:hypothetical protein
MSEAEQHAETGCSQKLCVNVSKVIVSEDTIKKLGFFEGRF